jgi:H+-transporting ATPase
MNTMPMAELRTKLGASPDGLTQAEAQKRRQAGNAIAALKAQLAINARVKRDGKWVTPPARELVPGDVIRVRLGDIVPADARLLDGDPVEVDQSALTGESLPAERKPGDAVFSGSIIRQGEIGALVYATGDKTYFGKTAQLVQDTHSVSHFQRAVLKIGNYLIILAVVLVAVITFAILRGDRILTTLQFALVLTVAAIPVAMPTVLSVTMAVGARLLAKKQAIVSRRIFQRMNSYAIYRIAETLRVLLFMTLAIPPRIGSWIAPTRRPRPSPRTGSPLTHSNMRS